MKRGPGRREGEAPPGSWNSGVQVPGRARGDVSAFRVMAHLPHVWVPSPSKALPSSRPGVWGSGLCSLLGPGREDRRPGPPPRDHHHRCLLHRHRPGERSTRPGGRGLWGGAFWGAGPAAPECLTRGAHAGYLQQPLGDIPHPLFALVYLSVLLVGRHPKSLSVSVKVSRISVF